MGRLPSLGVVTPPLPEPDSEELAQLVGSSTQRLLYGLLYRRRSNPPTMSELRLFARDALGEDHSHVDRRVRELRRYFDIPAEGHGSEHRYVLKGWARTPAAAGEGISLRRRAEVLSPGRCAQCGRTPLGDGIKLVVDHRVPQSWGGSNDIENLQPLCEDCNAGKRDYFASFENFAEHIRAAVKYDEPQRRIGELLKSFDTQWVRTDLIAIVASAGSYQEDWQRRMRDLRFLGWDYESKKSYNEGSRVWSYYRLTQSAPWPHSIPAAIRAETARRDQARRAARSDDPSASE